ncbi:unnamed protein product [Parnassius apollo]|uniref:Lipase n=1 Tax=Parnassius apollo TaxID=110799 RepID=A0A8S3XAD2_PARAO|nr:unnamed protein product [Parnassius apollo]
MTSKGNDVIFPLLLFIAVFKNTFGKNWDFGIDEDATSQDYPRDSLSNFTEFARNYGYAAEEHTVITEDGYILSIFRIPKGKNCRGRVRQPPVLLMHGLLQSSDSWLDAGPSAGLAFLISDACYDLWVGNVRGTYYGRRNVRLNPDADSQFWNFTSHEMGILDVPSIINYMLNETGSSELIYVGYSQGARIFFIMCSETFGYCDKIKVSINIAPAARVKYTRSVPIQLLTRFYAVTEPFLSGPRELEVLQKEGLIQKASSFFCKDSILAGTVCRAALALIDSYDPGSILTQTIRVLFGHFPAGTSARNLAVFGQNVIAGRFQKYDYGPSKNLELYGTVNPPLYNLNRTNMPVVLLHSENDLLVDSKDVQWLSAQLPNLIESYKVRHSTWTHFDNCYSRYTNITIFLKIREYLHKYSKYGSV